MKKRIFSGMLWLTSISLLVVSFTLSAVFYWQLSVSAQREMRERALMLRDGLIASDHLSLADMRLTLIASDGRVIYDDDQDAASLPSHADREEVSEALQTGIGESRRFSDTLGQETYYYAIKLEDGTVLRLAKTIRTIWGVFVGAFPAIIAVIAVMSAISYFLAGKLTKRIIHPINAVDLDAQLSAPYDELAPFVQTISRQRERIAQQMADLKDRADTMAAIMDSMNEGLILIDRKGNILSVNQSAVKIFAVTHELIGKSILEVLRDVALGDPMRAALSGQHSELELSRGSSVYRVFFSPAADNGAVILFLDVTEKTVAERLRREFSANVSHELKTPLTTIYGNVEMLENAMVKEADQKQFYQKIRNEAARLMRLIEDIMMLSRLDEGHHAARAEDVDLISVTSEVLESLAPKARERDVTIDISGSGSLPANRSQMVEMMYNLLDNAIKYNLPGGNVRVQINQLDQAVQIIVADTGIGIPKEAQSRVFERFYRVDTSRSKQTGGTGLGLAIVKHIAAIYHGSVELWSAVDEGTCITVTLYAEK